MDSNHFDKTLRENFASENFEFFKNIKTLFDHGKLSDTKKLIILPVDQGFEHGPEKSFSPNPDAFDPHYHYKFAKTVGFNALCGPLGMLEAVASLREKEIHAFNFAMKKTLYSIALQSSTHLPVFNEDDFSDFTNNAFTKLNNYTSLFESLMEGLKEPMPTSWEEFKNIIKKGHSLASLLPPNSQRMQFYSTIISIHQDIMSGIFGNELDWTNGRNYTSWCDPLPTILKLNSSNYIDSTADSEPNQSFNSSVADAIRMGCIGVGFTIYPGSRNFHNMLERLGAIITEARKHGLLVIVWAYPRGSNLKDDKQSRSSIDIATYAAHIACLMGAHIVKVKIPENTKYWKNLKEFFPEKLSDVQNVRLIKRACFNGRRFVVFSGGEMSDETSLQNHAFAVRDGNGDGSMIGRNCFQRSFADAKNLVDKIVEIYKMPNGRLS